MFSLEKTEKDIMNLFALVTAIKSSAENVTQHIDGDTGQLDEHCESVMNLCDIAKDKLSNVWKDVSDIETADENNETPVITDAEGEIDSESKPLAVLIASILASPDIPDELFDAIVEGLDVVADKGRFKTLRKLETSPKYISKILSDYAEAQSK